jgi:hypothetical protein
VDPATDNVLVPRRTDGTWSITSSQPGSGNNILGGIVNMDGQLWAAAGPGSDAHGRRRAPAPASSRPPDP